MATMPPTAVKRMTKAAAISVPKGAEIFPSEATFKMNPPATN